MAGVGSSCGSTVNMVRRSGNSALKASAKVLQQSPGVIKTHRLTYGSSTSLYARANRGECTSFWVASSRVLKDWSVLAPPEASLSSS